MKGEKLSIREMIQINCRGISLIFKLVPWNLPFCCITAFLDVLYSYWSYLFLARLVDDIAEKVSKAVIIQDAILLVGGYLFVQTVFEIWMHYYFYCSSNIWEQANYHLNQKIMNMDYEYMESEHIQNMRRDIDAMARNDGGGMNLLFWYITPVIEKTLHILIAFGYTAYLLSRCRIVFEGEPVKAIAFSVFFICVLVVMIVLSIRINKDSQEKIYQCSEKSLPYYRHYNFYTNEYIAKEECGKTIRMFHQQNLLFYRIAELYEKIYKIITLVKNLREKVSVATGIIEAVISGFIYFILGVMVLKNAITIGSVCLYAGCISNFLLHFREWISQLTQLAANTKYVKMYFDFIDIPQKIRRYASGRKKG